MSASEANRPAPRQEPARESLDEQARRKGVRPIGDGRWLVREDLFAEPGEVDEFVAYVHDSRRASAAS
jgi:hypothetical protein